MNNPVQKIWDELHFKETQSESVAGPSISALAIQKLNIDANGIICGREEHFKNFGLDKPNQEVNRSKMDQLGSII